MKLMKKTNTYKASNVTFNLTTKDAYSYNWWRFVAIIEGKLVFNNYRYSPSTGNHQRKVRNLLRELGIKIDVELPLPKGINQGMTLKEIYEEAENTLIDNFLYEEIKKDRRNELAKQKRLEKKIRESGLYQASQEMEQITQ